VKPVPAAAAEVDSAAEVGAVDLVGAAEGAAVGTAAEVDEVGIAGGAVGIAGAMGAAGKSALLDAVV